ANPSLLLSKRPSWVTRTGLLRVNAHPLVSSPPACKMTPPVKLSAIVSARVWSGQHAIRVARTRAGASRRENRGKTFKVEFWILHFIAILSLKLTFQPALPEPGFELRV